MWLLQAVQSLLDEEFPGIRHIHTSTLHKKVTNARHDFVRLTGTENKLEALIQVGCDTSLCCNSGGCSERQTCRFHKLDMKISCFNPIESLR